MTDSLKAIAVAAALTALAACAGPGGPGGPASAGAPEYYDGYYDGFYGPIYDGYWGDDNFFYRSGGAGQPFVRDEGNHFQRNGAAGFSAFHQAHMGPHTGHPHEARHR